MGEGWRSKAKITLHVNCPEGERTVKMRFVNPAPSLTERLHSFSFFCRVSCASFSFSSWICPVNAKHLMLVFK